MKRAWPILIVFLSISSRLYGTSDEYSKFIQTAQCVDRFTKNANQKSAGKKLFFDHRINEEKIKKLLPLSIDAILMELAKEKIKIVFHRHKNPNPEWITEPLPLQISAIFFEDFWERFSENMKSESADPSRVAALFLTPYHSSNEIKEPLLILTDYYTKADLLHEYMHYLIFKSQPEFRCFGKPLDLEETLSNAIYSYQVLGREFMTQQDTHVNTEKLKKLLLSELIILRAHADETFSELEIPYYIIDHGTNFNGVGLERAKRQIVESIGNDHELDHLGVFYEGTLVNIREFFETISKEEMRILVDVREFLIIKRNKLNQLRKLIGA